MGLYLLNISVDAADAKPQHIPEDLAFNDQESIVELVVEMVLGFEDAFQEYDDHDTEDHNNKKNAKIDLVVLENCPKNNHQDQVTQRKKAYPAYKTRLTKGFTEIDSPPPKV